MKKKVDMMDALNSDKGWSCGLGLVEGGVQQRNNFGKVHNTLTWGDELVYF